MLKELLNMRFLVKHYLDLSTIIFTKKNMCYNIQEGKLAGVLTDYLNLNMDADENVFLSDFKNGFSYPNLTIILVNNP